MSDELRSYILGQIVGNMILVGIIFLMFMVRRKKD